MGEDESKGAGRSLDALLGEIARSPNVTPAGSLIGDVLGDRYRVDALLGRGGMGVVYRAFDTKLSRDVALKVLPPELLGDLEQRRSGSGGGGGGDGQPARATEKRARFLREAKLAAAITHPNTAAIYDVGHDGEVVFVAMELVIGKTLRARLDEGSSLEPHRAAQIAHEIARGLTKAHELGIVHRDLKPENLMLVDEDGHVKILDFGLAKLREAAEGGRAPTSMSTELGRIMGTPSYMSPEQAKGKSVDARSDIFSLGVVLYEMLASKRPFVGETTMEILIAIDRDPPAPLDPNKDVPSELVAILDRCLAKEPAERFASARELAESLKSVAATTATTRASSRSKKTPDRAARFKRAAALVLAASAIAALGAIAVSRRHPFKSTSDDATAKAATAATTATALFAKSDAVLACPLLDASGVDAPTGWLGAAAASLVCQRAHWMLGAKYPRTLTPAELVGLPKAVMDDGPADPYGDPHARERTIAKAKASATAYVDGTIERTESAFHVVLVLRTPDGAEVARGDATTPAFDRTVAAAMDGLGLPWRELDHDVSRWLGIRDAHLALAFADWEVSINLGGPQTMMPLLREHVAELGPWWPMIQTLSASIEEEPSDNVTPPPIDRSSPEALARSAMARWAVKADIDDATADEIHVLYERERPGTYGRSLLASAEGQIRLAHPTSNGGRAYDLLRGAAEEDPRSSMVWTTLDFVAMTTTSAFPVAKTSAYWMPHNPNFWLSSSANSAASLKTDPTLTRRGWQLGSESSTCAGAHANALFRAGKREEPRSIAMRLLHAGPLQRRVAEALLVSVEMSYARFGAAAVRVQGLFDELPLFGTDSPVSTALFLAMTDAAVLSGKGHELGDSFAQRFVLSNPPRLFPGPFVAGDAAGACAIATPDTAKRCVARLEELLASGFFRLGTFPATKPHVDALQAHLAGNDRRAAELLRSSFDAGRFDRYGYVADVFDRVGDIEFAEKVDAITMAFPGYNGAMPAHVRAAKRAAKRGDAKRARELAEKVIEAWSVADAQVDAMREMRELVAKLR